MLKGEIIVLFGVVVMMHLALGVVMNILFYKKRARVKITESGKRE